METNPKRNKRKRAPKKAEAPEYKVLKYEKSKKGAPGKPEPTRLNKYIANAGICSRREADKLISDGLIKVNKKVVTELGFKVNPGDDVYYKGELLRKEKFVYVLLNKPKDHITTMDDPFERKTVMKLVSNASDERIYPVGRLDRNTTGLLLLTNDGDLANKLTHPSNEVRKIYQVELDKPILQVDIDKITEGLILDDGPAKVDAIEVLNEEATIVGVEIHIGRNRIVRRIFESLGYNVDKLDRTVFAGLTKKDLGRGKWRFLKEKEVAKLKSTKH